MHFFPFVLIFWTEELRQNDAGPGSDNAGPGSENEGPESMVQVLEVIMLVPGGDILWPELMSEEN